MLDSFRDCFSPDKRGVAGDENAGNGEGVEVLCAEAADDDSGGVSDVGLGDLLGGEGLGDGNGAVEVVGVGCAEAGDRASSLGPGGCELGVGVDDAADLGEFAVEVCMCIQVT